MRDMLPRGATSFRICPWVDGKPMVDKVRKAKGWLHAPMWEEAARSGQVLCCLIDPSDLRDVSAMCAAHPRTRVVLDHLARVGAAGDTFPHEEVSALISMAAHPNVHVKLSAAYALGVGQPPYGDLKPLMRQLLEAFGPSRLLWGSDAPYQLGSATDEAAIDELYRASLDCVRAICGTPEMARAICGGNAERLFFFDRSIGGAGNGAAGIGAANGNQNGLRVEGQTAGKKRSAPADEAAALGHPELSAVVGHLRALIATPSVNPE